MLIAVPITANSLKGAETEIANADRVADLIELRLDMLKGEFDAGALVKKAGNPVIVTCRRRAEGGKFGGSEKERIGILLGALKAKPKYLDIEFSTNEKLRKKVIAKKGKTKIILSWHAVKKTPSPKALAAKLAAMKKVRGVDVIKMVAKANSAGDNFKVIGLLKSRGKRKMVAFCTGPRGKISRIVAPLEGSMFTFASLAAGKESAEGQIPIKELRRIYGAWEK